LTPSDAKSAGQMYIFAAYISC